MSWSASNSGRRYGSTFAIRSPGRKPSRSPASTAGRVRMIRLTSRRCSAAAASATARNVLPVPAGPIPKVIVLRADRVDVALLVDRLRRDLGGAVAPDDVLEDRRRATRAASSARDDRLDRPGRDLVTLRDQLRQLADRPSAPARPPPARRRASARCRAGRSSQSSWSAQRARIVSPVPASSVAVALSSSICCRIERALVSSVVTPAPPAPRGPPPRRACRRPDRRPGPSPRFITRPMSFGELAPVSAIASSTIASQLLVVELGRQVSGDHPRLGLLPARRGRRGRRRGTASPPRAGACARAAAPRARRRRPPWRPSGARRRSRRRAPTRSFSPAFIARPSCRREPVP